MVKYFVVKIVDKFLDTLINKIFIINYIKIS